MLRKCFSVASFVMIAGVAVVWAGCGDDDSASTGGSTDAGASTNTVTDGGSTTPDTGTTNPLVTPHLDGGVAITYGTCQTFTKCGGNVVGDWKVTGGCLDKSTFDDARHTCEGLQESDVTIEAAGTVDFTDAQMTRSTTVLLTGNVFIPTSSNACSAAKGINCTFLGFGLTSKTSAPGGLAFDTADCKDTTGGCNCAVTKKTTDSATQAYTAADSTITTQDPAQTFDYCVNGNSDTYFETTTGQPLKLYITIGK